MGLWNVPSVSFCFSLYLHASGKLLSQAQVKDPAAQHTVGWTGGLGSPCDFQCGSWSGAGAQGAVFSSSQACPDLALLDVALALQQARPIYRCPGGGRGVGYLTRGDLRETALPRRMRHPAEGSETAGITGDPVCRHLLPSPALSGWPGLSSAESGEVRAGGEPGFRVRLPLWTCVRTCTHPSPTLPLSQPSLRVYVRLHTSPHPSILPSVLSSTCSVAHSSLLRALTWLRASFVLPPSVGCYPVPPMGRLGWVHGTPGRAQ